MTARFCVDFNEMLQSDLLMLSQTDLRQNIHGQPVVLHEGLAAEVQQESHYAYAARERCD